MKPGSVLRKLGLRADALDWDPPWQADPEPEIRRASADIVLPVFGAHDDLRRCLDALARHTDLERHRLVVVVDGDPDWRSELLAPVRAQQPEARVLVLENETNRGYVHSVNRGMAASTAAGTSAGFGAGAPVLLLNSDAVVTKGWLDKMLEAAASRADAATVTPFSNHATLCSLPEPWVANELPEGLDVDGFAALVENVSARSYPTLPTGVGFCLLVRRAVLEEQGLFDEDAFGAGYGEETDFCLRALKSCWVHLLDDATFVYHRGESSFGESRAERVATAERVLAQRHPEYVPTIAAFMGEDPLWEARRRVRWRLRRTAGPKPARSARRVLHVVHGWPPYNHAGTEFYAHALVHRQKEHREVAVYTRIADFERQFGDTKEIDDDGVRVRLVVNNFVQRSPLSRNVLRSREIERDFARLLDDFGPDLVHIHHLAGHALSLPGLVAARGIPLVYQVQDWFALCARANFMHRSGELCPGSVAGALRRLPADDRTARRGCAESAALPLSARLGGARRGPG